MLRFLPICLLIASTTWGKITFSQTTDSAANQVTITGKYVEAVSEKVSKLQSKLDKKAAKALSAFQKQEERIIRKLSLKDSSKAAELARNSREKFESLKQNLENPGKLGEYIPFLDTIKTSLNFLQVGGAETKIKDALGKVNGLENQLQKAETIKSFIRERKQLLKEQLGNLGFAKELKKLNKQAYYYSQQVNEYKEILKDSKKAERKAIELLSKTKLFQDFMRKHSQLASLFRLPGDPNDPAAQASLAGLQTRAQVNQLIQQQIGSAPGAMQQFRQNVQDAQGQLQEIKNKINQFTGEGSIGSSDMDMPEGYKPNDQKTKSFFKRLELGTNMQSQKATGFFPTTSDIGLSLGYKLNDKSILGVGASYKVGWGTGFRDIEISHQGLGLRSFVDMKLKGSFWITGGYEMNYRSEFQNIEVLKDMNAWQQSGLVGLSKVVSLKTKFFKKTKLQLLWDFMSYEQVPRSQPVVFRVGYNF